MSKILIDEAKLKLALEQRITDYLSAGGLFNPELADHVAVRDLLIDCRKALAEQKSGIKQVIELYDSPDQPSQQEPGRNHWEDGDVFERIGAMKKQPSQQEPVAWICEGSSSDEKHAIDYWPGDIEDIPIGTKLYTSPPAQRTWVGLTGSEITTSPPYSVTRDKGCFHAGALWAEAKLKEKNQ